MVVPWFTRVDGCEIFVSIDLDVSPKVGLSDPCSHVGRSNYSKPYVDRSQRNGLSSIEHESLEKLRSWPMSRGKTKHRIPVASMMGMTELSSKAVVPDETTRSHTPGVCRLNLGNLG